MDVNSCSSGSNSYLMSTMDPSIIGPTQTALLASRWLLALGLACASLAALLAALVITVPKFRNDWRDMLVISALWGTATVRGWHGLGAGKGKWAE